MQDTSLVGQSLGSWMGFQDRRCFPPQEEADEYCTVIRQSSDTRQGSRKYVDADGDGKDKLHNDRTWLGCDLPQGLIASDLISPPTGARL